MKPVLPAALLLTALLAACDSQTAPEPVAPTPTPPTLILNALPEGGVTQRARLPLSGRVSDIDGVQKVELRVNGGAAVAAKLSGETFEVNADLKAGLNTYTVTATDKLGASVKVDGEVALGRQVAAGGSHSAALNGGALYTWGRNNLGQLGLGKTSTLAADTTHPSSPVKVTTPAAFVALAFNQNQSLALDADGALYSWGDDADGQLGRGDAGRASCGTGKSNCRLDIGRVDGLPAAVQVSAGYSHTLVLDAAGAVWAFGANTNGQLGDGTSTGRSQPVKVVWGSAQPGRIVQVAASSASSYALDDQGALWGWGRNQYGNLGQGTAGDSKAVQAAPLRVPLPEGVRVREIAVGRDHVLALTEAGQLYAWGLNASSQVGYNGVKFKDKADAWPGNVVSPRALPDAATLKVLDVYANGNTSYLRAEDGKLYAWGMYGESEGTGAVYANLDQPSDKLPALSGVRDLAVGALHQVARRNDGKLFSWGWSFEGSLGGGSATTTNAWMYNYPLSLTLP